VPVAGGGWLWGLVMTDTRYKNARWTIHTNDNGTIPASDARLAVLMDIRDEMQSIVSLLRCHRIPKALDAVVAMHKQGVKRRVVKKRVKK